MTDSDIYLFVIILYFILLTNIGFEDRILDNIENNKGGGKKIYLLNGITLISFLSFYFISKFGGKFLIKIDETKEEKIDEPFEICMGSIPYTALQTIFSTVLSGLIYFKKIDNYENYLLSITKGSVEYIKINVLEYYALLVELSSKNIVFFSNSTILSFYLLIWRIILFILELLEINNNSLMLFQFIIGILFCGFLLVCFIIIIIEKIMENDKEKKESEDIDKTKI